MTHLRSNSLTPKARILVLDAEQRSALAAVRSLGRAGATVFVASALRHPLAGGSAFAHGKLYTPDPAREAAAYTASIIKYAIDKDLDFILPTTDTSTMLLVGQQAMGAARVLCPPREAYERVTDKANLLEIADSVGVRAPDTVVATNRLEIEAAIGGFGNPVV